MKVKCINAKGIQDPWPKLEEGATYTVFKKVGSPEYNAPGFVLEEILIPSPGCPAKRLAAYKQIRFVPLHIWEAEFNVTEEIPDCIGVDR